MLHRMSPMQFSVSATWYCCLICCIYSKSLFRVEREAIVIICLPVYDNIFNVAYHYCPINHKKIYTRSKIPDCKCYLLVDLVVLVVLRKLPPTYSAKISGHGCVFILPFPTFFPFLFFFLFPSFFFLSMEILWVCK